MKTIFFASWVAYAFVPSIIDLLYETQGMVSDFQRHDQGKIQSKFIQDCSEGVIDLEMQTFTEISLCQTKVHEKLEEIKSANYFIAKCTSSLKHDSEQLIQIKDKRCYENLNFVNALSALYESQETLNDLTEELKNYIGNYDTIFVEKVLGAIKILNEPSLIELGYNLYSHSYEFSTENRNKEDESRTQHALEYAKEKKIGSLDSDLSIVIEKLKEFVDSEITALENREIKTAHDIVNWELELQKESAQLLDDIQRKKYLIEKIERDVERIQQLKGLNEVVWEESKILQSILQSFELHSKEFQDASEKNRKHTQEAITEALYIFETQFPEYSDYVRNKRPNFTL